MSRQSELAELSRVYDSSTLSNRNVVMNGEFAISQRGTSFTNIGSAGTYDDTFTMDRFLISQGQSAGRCSVEQSSDTPDGFSKSLKVSCTTADTSVGAAEYHRVQTKFEGQDLQRFAKGTSGAKQYTLSFHCKANAAATYVVELYDQDNQRTVAKTFSVTTDWTKVILTFPADTTGAFDNDNNLSMELNWWLHTGSTYGGGTLQTTWGSIVQANRAAGIDSFFDSTNRTFFITGVQLEVGDTATPFEHRSVGDELARCQRYYTKYYETGGSGSNAYLRYGYGTCENTTRAEIPINTHTLMRADPSLETTGTFSNYSIWQRGSVIALTNLTTEGSGHSNNQLVTLTATVASGLNAGDSVGLMNNNSTTAYLALSSEL